MSDEAGQDGKRICGSVAFAVVPADVLEDSGLSRHARWLFSLLCRHADPEGHCHRSLTRLARQEGCSTRALQKWMGELEAAGLVAKLNERGKIGAFFLARDPADRKRVLTHNLQAVTARQAEFGGYGRRGAERRHTREQPFTGEHAEPPQSENTTREQPFTPPVNSGSPPREQEFTSTREQPFAHNKTRTNKTRKTSPAQHEAAAAIVDESPVIAAEAMQPTPPAPPAPEPSLPRRRPDEGDRYAESHRRAMEERRQRQDAEDAERHRLTMRFASLIQVRRGMDAAPAMGKARLAMACLQDNDIVVQHVTGTRPADDAALWPLIDNALRQFEGTP